MLDEVEQCRLRPVDVVDHDDERAFRRERLEQSPGRPEQLLRRARGLDRPGEREQAIRGGFGLGTAPEQRDQMTTFGLRLDLLLACLGEQAAMLRHAHHVQDQRDLAVAHNRGSVRRDFPTPGAPSTVNR